MAVISTGVVNGAGRKTVTIYEPGGVDAAHAGRADGEGFIDSLMSRLSLEEKIGQLNLPVGGDVVSGTARSTGIDSLILAGRIGGFFNVKGVEAISRFQRLAVERGPHGIPLLVGADVVHGYATVFPIPAGAGLRKVRVRIHGWAVFWPRRTYRVIKVTVSGRTPR